VLLKLNEHGFIGCLDVDPVLKLADHFIHVAYQTETVNLPENLNCILQTGQVIIVDRNILKRKCLCIIVLVVLFLWPVNRCVLPIYQVVEIPEERALIDRLKGITNSVVDSFKQFFQSPTPKGEQLIQNFQP
jgi:hypothetical protein